MKVFNGVTQDSDPQPSTPAGFAHLQVTAGRGPETPNLKVGDRVRVVADIFLDSGNVRGLEGTIKEFDDERIPYSSLVVIDKFAQFSSEESSYWFRTEELEPLTGNLPSNAKDSNPKDAIGAGKLPLHLFPTTAIAYGSIAMMDGGLKYGRSNFRAIGVRASIYYDGARRHLDAWFEGEDNAPDTGLDHLGYALANIAILIDARCAGKLNDDRMIDGGYRNCVDELTKHIERLKELHKEKSPHHYTIKDSK